MKKLLSLLLALTMALSLCACGGGDNAKDPAGSSQPGNSADPDSIPAGEILEEITLPLCDEKKELSVWLIWTNSATADPNSLEGTQYIEELTNVHINWITVTADEAGEKYNLLQASDNLPDIILAADANSSSPITVDAAIADGWIIDMSDLIAKYMPNYREFLATHELERKTLASQDGVVRCFSNLAGNDEKLVGEQQWAGLAVRSDLIEKAGYTGKLETIEDYHNMLLTCKNNLEGLSAPLYVSSGGYGISGAFLSAYDTCTTVMTHGDNKVVYGPVQEGYGQWLEEMRKWYAEGLIDPNFDSVSGLDPFWAPASVVGTNQTVCFTTLYNNLGTVMPMILGNIADPTAVITAVENPVLKSGDQPMLINVGTGSAQSACITGNIYITPDCKEPELAAQWLDFMMTEQAMVAGQYGREGVQYTLHEEEGAPFKYVYNEGYQTEDERTAKIGFPGLGWYNWDTNRQSATAQMDALLASYAAQGLTFPDTYQMFMDAKEMWTAQGSIDNMLGITPTPEEAATIVTIKADIETRVSEYTVQYIKGMTDESFADFCQELENMQLSAVLEVYQAAYDRYQAK